ncbi:hypothetical protein FOTG_15179 [Fusarium oxysporum f. sp. vasinfectum 25433]|uniref:BTB domain-containing protein n=1 Tax=Fusarium oxysporum f. sp. vasinfectum 25433 TaxID=1089449 RepID=X0L639_FUSOX|nr:hypothetical protein FOTG_15179 [Fusarium oxysporum f. sp. vasinfectum 25433]
MELVSNKALVAHQSPALAAMVNEKSQESREYSVKWDDVDEMVFNSFWQFVYTGDYDTPEPLRPTRKTSGREDHKSGTAHEPAEVEAEAEAGPAAIPEVGIEELLSAFPDWPNVSATETESESESEPEAQAQAQAQAVQKSLLWDSFLRRRESPHEVIDIIDKPQKGQANPFVHHARVFTLANRYGVKRLAEVSHGKLHHDLVDLERQDMDSKNVVELVRYAFEELVPDQLRDLVVHFSACVVERIWGDKIFQELLEKHGILSEALIRRLFLYGSTKVRDKYITRILILEDLYKKRKRWIN